MRYRSMEESHVDNVREINGDVKHAGVANSVPAAATRPLCIFKSLLTKSLIVFNYLFKSNFLNALNIPG